jgi:hypothetical protein
MGADASLAIPGVLVTILTLAPVVKTVHPSTMTLNCAASLALIGTLLLTGLVAADFIGNVSGALRDLVPAITVLWSLAKAHFRAHATLQTYRFSRASQQSLAAPVQCSSEHCRLDVAMVRLHFWRS